MFLEDIKMLVALSKNRSDMGRKRKEESGRGGDKEVYL